MIITQKLLSTLAKQIKIMNFTYFFLANILLRHKNNLLKHNLWVGSQNYK